MSGLRLDIDVLGPGFRLQVRLPTPVDRLVVAGPNGSGKSTLLKAVVGAPTPARGHIELGDRILFDQDRGIDRAPADRGLGYVPQTLQLLPHKSALENLLFVKTLGAPQRARTRRDEALARLARLGLGARAHTPSGALSRGEQQRVAIARALMRNADALLLDEPTASLDADGRAAVRDQLMAEIQDRAVPTVLVTHDVADAIALDAPIAILERGALRQFGSLDALRSAPATPFVARFVAGARAAVSGETQHP